MSSRQPKTPRVGTVFATVFIDLLGFGIVIPLLPIYSKAYDAGEFELGCLFGIFSFMQFCSSPIWGRTSDRIGRRGVILVGLLGTAAAYTWFAFATSIVQLFVARALAGFFGATVPTAQAYIADVTAPEDRAKGMGKIGAAFGIGFTVGPLFGGELTKIDHRLPGLAAAAFSLLAFLVGFFNLVEPARNRVERISRSVRDVVRTNGRLARLLILFFIYMFAVSAFESMLTRYGMARFPAVYGLKTTVENATMDDLFAAAPIAGRYLSLVGVISSIIQAGFTARLVRRYGEKRLAVVGPAILAIAFFTMAAGSVIPGTDHQRWLVVILGCFIAPFGFGLNNPSIVGLISRSAGPGDQGAALGLGQSAAGLGRVIGPPCAGFLFARFFPAAPFLFSGLVLIVSSFLASRIDRVAPLSETSEKL